MKKRKAVSNNNDEGDKRFRSEEASSSSDGIHGGNSSDDRTSNPRVAVTLAQDLLVVPYEIIFREVASSGSSSRSSSSNCSTGKGSHSGHRRKPWLSRPEAQCLIEINLLAHEIDSLASLTNQTIQQALYCRCFASLLHRSSNGRHPFLRPLLPLLSSLERGATQSVMPNITTTLQHKVVPALRRSVLQLKRSSQQNWAVYETLLDAVAAAAGAAASSEEEDTEATVSTSRPGTAVGGDVGRVLAEEKRNLADIQDELRQRIDSLLLDYRYGTSDSSSDNCKNNNVIHKDLDAAATTNPLLNLESMKDFCYRIFFPHSDTATTEQSLDKNAVSESSAIHDDEEILEDEGDDQPFHTATATTTTAATRLAVPSPAATEPATLSRAAHSHTVSSPSSTPSRSNVSVRLQSAAGRKEDILASTDLLFAPHRLMTESSLVSSSSKKRARRDEKENAPSQQPGSQSQSSSSSSTQPKSPAASANALMVYESSVLETMAMMSSPSRKTLLSSASATIQSQLEKVAGNDSESEDEATPLFQSQGAAHVLSTMAATSSSALSLRMGATRRREETPPKSSQ